MSVYSFLSLSVFHICVFSGAYVLLMASDSKTHRMYFLLALLAGVWNLFSAVLYSMRSQEAIWLWFRIAAPFGIVFVAMILPFVLLLTGARAPWWVFAVLLLPAALMCWQNWAGAFMFDSITYRDGSLIFHPARDSPWMYVWLAYSHTLTLIALVILYRWMKTAPSRRLRRQAFVIFLSLLLYAALASSSDYLFAHRLMVGSVSPMLFVIFLIGSAYAIVRYRLFSITHKAVSGDIVSSMDMMIIMLDQELRIVKVNPRAESVTGMTERELLSQSVTKLTGTDTIVEEGLSRVLSEDIPRFSCVGELMRNDERVIVEMQFTQVRDHGGEVLGLLLTGDEIQSPKRFMSRHQITAREWETILQIASGATNKAIAEHLHITERTVKAHITHIFAKLNVSCRTELLALLREMRVLSGLASQVADQQPEHQHLIGAPTGSSE